MHQRFTSHGHGGRRLVEPSSLCANFQVILWNSFGQLSHHSPRYYASDFKRPEISVTGALFIRSVLHIALRSIGACVVLQQRLTTKIMDPA